MGSVGQASGYLDGANPVAPLSRQEEAALATRYREHNDERAAHTLVRSHLRFVFKLAHGFGGYGLRFEDLVQEGNLGLLEAVRRFDPSRGHRLISYAVHWIRAQMRAYAIQQYSIVRLGTSQVQRKLFYQLRRTIRSMEEEDPGSPVDDDRLAERLGVSIRSVVEMRKRLRARDLSMQAPIRGDPERTVASTLVTDTQTPEERLAEAELAFRVQERLPKLMQDSLDERERTIISLRLLEEPRWTLERIGRSLGITRERTRQLEARAKQKLQVGLVDLMT